MYNSYLGVQKDILKIRYFERRSVVPRSDLIEHKMILLILIRLLPWSMAAHW